MKLAFHPAEHRGRADCRLDRQEDLRGVWGLIDDQEPPDAKHREISFPKLIVALIFEGAIFRLVKGLTDHGARQAFARATGAWPGEEAPEPE